VAKLADMRKLEADHLAIIAALLQADDGNIYTTDLWVGAALNRSIHVLAGFCWMVERRNAACAVGLLRFQLDTAMRLFAISLVKNPDEFVSALIGGERLDRMTDRHGKQLRDRYLAEELTKQRDWFLRVYDNTSGFVHMSGRHITTAALSVEDFQVVQSFGAVDDHWTAEDIEEAVDAFQATTEMILSMGCSMLHGKNNLASRPPPGATDA
jgi:hypothetical protein